ncbi:MAG: M48 family metallopeptidase [Clostridiales bacterium]|nr:M48 family metallopeptidase [Clostridiales bacterium]
MEHVADIAYEVVRTNRKTITFYFRDGYLDVRAPLNCPDEFIVSYIESNKKYLEAKLLETTGLLSQKKGFELRYGSLVRFRGKKYPIQARDGYRSGFDGECFWMPYGLAPDLIIDTCVKIYRSAAQSLIPSKVNDYARIMGVTPQSVKIGNARTAWGSCRNGHLIFAWRLMMASDYALDCVVVHELAHIKHPNHSKWFWAFVKRFMPDYELRKEELNKLSREIGWENWEKKEF